MADLRVTGGASPNALQPARPSEAARAAQRAFFQAALNGVSPTQATRPQSQPASRTAAAAAPAPQSAAAEPTRYARPGSLLDIKV